LVSLLPLLTEKIYGDMTTPEFYQKSPKVDCVNVKNGLKDSGIICNKINQSIVDKYVGYLKMIKYI